MKSGGHLRASSNSGGMAAILGVWPQFPQLKRRWLGAGAADKQQEQEPCINSSLLLLREHV